MANLRVDKITSTETFETTGSVQFDGDGDYLEISDIDDLTFGSGDYTIEAWIYIDDGAQQYQGIFGSSGTGSDSIQFKLRDEKLGLSSYTTELIVADAADAVTVRRWTHIAISRNGTGSTNTRMFKDGKLIKSGTDNITWGSYDRRIGRIFSNSAYDFQGHISNLRVVKGKALYTENFTPPARELTVTPETVLLACQHKTDASHEKTGKTITVNGNAVANELTPGLLTDVVKSGGSSAITGSVEFDGTGDYLQVTADSDLSLTGDFTVEYWVYMSNTETNMRQISSANYYTAGKNGNWYFGINKSTGNVTFYSYDGQSSGEFVSVNYTQASLNSWYHLAATRVGSTVRLFVNGESIGSGTISKDLVDGADGGLQIGRLTVYGDHYGFISNLRIVKGTALYTDNFIPPTRELKKVPGTVLLCCQDKNSVTTEATGKTITSNGNPAASNFTPQVGNDGSVEFVGPTKINTENYFYLPTGDTESRNLTNSRGDRGIFSGGHSPTNTIDYITISSSGNAQDFGDLTYKPFYGAACASSTSGLHAGGATPTIVNTINYLTIMTMGNAFEFGDLTGVKRDFNALASRTRGVFVGGITPTEIDTIDFVTIATTSNAIDFGNLSSTRQQVSGSSSPTRGIIAGGFVSPAAVNTIEYITIASTGDAVDFGDLATSTWALTALASQTRSIIGGGAINPGGGTTATNTASYITIASTGNANDFGDLTVGRFQLSGASNSTRGAFAGGYIPSPTSANQDTIDYVTIASTGNAQDFGNLTGTRREMGGCSNGHGGLG